jgi:cytochrome c-type biogenesis protein CcmH/NrfG
VLVLFRRFWRALSDICKYLGASLAIILVRRKLRRRPNDLRLWLTIARLYEIGCQWNQAVDALRHARRLSPKSQALSQELARVQQAVREARGLNPDGG